MLFIAQNRKRSSHSEAADAVERPVSPGQTNPLSMQSYHPSMSSPVSRNVLPKPGPRGLSLHDLFAATVGGLLIAPIAWAGADFQEIQHTGLANNDTPAAAPIQADTRVAAKPDTESILSENLNLIAPKSGLVNNTSFQAIVLQWTGPNGKQWVVPLSFDGVTSVAAIKINKPLAMIGVEHNTGELKPETPTENTVAANNLPALRHTTWSMNSTDAEKAQPKL